MKARTVVGRREEGPLCDPESELLLRVDESSARIISGIKRKGKKKCSCTGCSQCPALVLVVDLQAACAAINIYHL